MAQEITLDASGRLALPKDVRIRHQLSTGSRLILITEEDRLVLFPKNADPRLIERASLLVVAGIESSTIPDHRHLREDRLTAHQSPTLDPR